MNVKQLIPKEDKAIIRRALESYRNTLGLVIDKHDAEDNKSSNIIADNLRHEHFDIAGLIGMMNYDVEIALPKAHKDSFCFKHNVDFPEYNEDIEREYPVVKEEWVTVIMGDISYTDDHVHERIATINNIVTIDRHLVSQLDEVIDDIDNSGHGYLVVENWDGAIELDIVAPKVKDEREFQVVDICGSYTNTVTFNELTDGEEDQFFRSMDVMEHGECYERHTSEVFIIRIK